jgi:hypothetical protein
VPRKTQRERQAVKNVVGDNVATWAPDPKEPVWVATNQTDPDITTRISDRVVRYDRNGMLIEFAVVLSIFDNGAWREVLCIDTCNHGTVHRHRDGNHDESPEIIATLDPDDLESRHADAIDEAYDTWERQGHQ